MTAFLSEDDGSINLVHDCGRYRGQIGSGSDR